MSAAAQRVRDRAARSPFLRRIAGKSPLHAPAPGAGPNASGSKVGEDTLWELRERYEGKFPLEPISFGTARDFADSTDNLAGLAGSNLDMKDLQRCWTVKAILGNVAPGSKILEIGAGEPLVAGLLARLGYQVTVFDPYEGGGNGPREYAAFKRDYPDVNIVPEQFPARTPLPADFSAVYSISVLEHVPLDAIDDLIAAGDALLAGQGGCQIHAVDHVVAGWGAEEHLEKLRRIAGALGLSADALGETLSRLELDPETYFVSVDAHNRWRGALPYDRYPMRRIASIQLYSSGG